MARRIAAGNWKMHGDGAALAEVAALLSEPLPEGVDVLLCPPATLLHRMSVLAAGRIATGGQDCHPAARGAHTGDIAAGMLAEAGATHVILGHSERRTTYGETDALVAAKAAAALAAGLTPVICVGETAAQRDAGVTVATVTAQLSGALPEAATPRRLIVAYEPVWAIGTGRTPVPDEIAEVHAALRATLAARFGPAAGEVPLLYGGSVSAANAPAIFAVSEVDGALVGGASLTAESFRPIIAALAAAASGAGF